MANFDALFAGCESFMEGDVEINNDVTLPSEGEALEAESVAEDVGTEGGELAGEAETVDTKADAANMVFDQLLNMYRHVKYYGIDRTFLSLYNNNGALSRMVGYRFPSCESIDSVGSPRSQASRAFIIAMEDDGIFKRIWTWIKETAVKIYNFFIKVIDWFREACGNLDMRVGKLYKFYQQHTIVKEWDQIKSKSAKYIEESNVNTYKDKVNRLGRELNEIHHGIDAITGASSTNLLDQIADINKGMAAKLVDISGRIKARSTATAAGDNKTKLEDDKPNTDTYGRTKDKDDTEGTKALKEYVDRINKDLVDPLADAVGDMKLETDTLEEFAKADSKKYASLSLTINGNIVTIEKGTSIGSSGSDIPKAMIDMLKTCTAVLQGQLKYKQMMDMMNLANKQAKARAEQDSRLAGNGSLDYDATKDARLSMMGIVKCNSVFARILTINEKIVAKCCSMAASFQSCVKQELDKKDNTTPPKNTNENPKTETKPADQNPSGTGGHWW